DHDDPVGYLLVARVDGAAHVDQVTVRSDHQGRGVGGALIAQAIAWARAQKVTAVTLTTFSDVPWNRPLYEHLGFRVLTDDEIGPELRAVQRDEANKGFGPVGRVAMRLDFD
ncbi:MAG TPA: GNAT family N-acetyltransferase, partial [Acidimicrobiales bacterium]|nr:GNAT family N-acetyltransferase [Acidimicrobiales bacterium]